MKLFKHWNITTTIAAITIFAFAGAVSFIFWHKCISDAMGPEVFKLTYEFLLVGAIGGGISFLIKQREKEEIEKKEKREGEEIKKKEKKELIRKFYNDFILAYNSVKKIRRLLRARACRVSEDKKIELKITRYDELMQEFTVLQLQFEYFAEQVTSNTSLFQDSDTGIKSDDIKSCLNKIAEYLNNIVDDYEECHEKSDNKFLEGIQEIPLEDLMHVCDFIKPYKLAADFQKFKENVKSVMGKLAGLLTETKPEPL